MNFPNLKLLDCTLRDGGYYNNWDFSIDVINEYLHAMYVAGVDVVEIGFRTLNNSDYKGPCAFTSDAFLKGLQIPPELEIGVMVNGSEILGDRSEQERALTTLFPVDSSESRISIVRIACHVHEFESALPASRWLKNKGYTVGFNLMQVADCPTEEVVRLAVSASDWPVDVLYFADSLGSMSPAQTADLVRAFRQGWSGEMGIHTHDNMNLALQNTMRALDEGVTWLDSTVTGMGRGPGNAKTEYLAFEVNRLRGKNCNLVPLMNLIQRVLRPLQNACGWGTNTYYYMAGKYSIHPTYIQEMLSDSRYSEEDILAVIEHLRVVGGKRFSLNTLDAARHFYQGEPRGAWTPRSLLDGREVLLLGTGPGVQCHRHAIEHYIEKYRPFVMALNTQAQVESHLIDARVACHPVRLLADCEAHVKLPQPLITPASMLPADLLNALSGKELLDFGLGVQSDTFKFADTYALLPTSLVIAYALAVAAAGKAKRILLAGFDGYGADDPRNVEMNKLLKLYSECASDTELLAITPTVYDVKSNSVYGLVVGI